MPRGLRFRSRRSAADAPVALNLLPDRELLALARDNDADAFAVIYDRHATAAYSLAHRICGTRALAEDVVQEAFLSLWRRLDRYDAARGEVRSWLLGIVHNGAIDKLRQSRPARAPARGQRRSRGSAAVAGANRPAGRAARAGERGPGRPARAASRAASCDRTGVLRWPHPHGDRSASRAAGRDDQGADAARVGEAGGNSRRRRAPRPRTPEGWPCDRFADRRPRSLGRRCRGLRPARPRGG